MHIDDILKKVKRIHFIGIGGAGMCPLAEILIQLGYNVSGSDNNDTETFRRIEKEGAKVYLGQVKENITDDVELARFANKILAVAESAVSINNRKLTADNSTWVKTGIKKNLGKH